MNNIPSVKKIPVKSDASDKSRMVIEIREFDKKRYKIILEDHESFLLYKSEIRNYGIRENEYIPEDKYRLIMNELLPERAKKRVLHLLQRQFYTEKKLRDKLKEGFYPENIIEEVILYVKKYGYINDYEYTLQYISYHIEKEPRKKIESKLLQRGISKELISAIMEGLCNNDKKAEERELQQALRLLSKREYDPAMADYKEKRKQYEFLLRKGFSSSVINKAMMN